MHKATYAAPHTLVASISGGGGGGVWGKPGGSKSLCVQAFKLAAPLGRRIFGRVRQCPAWSFRGDLQFWIIQCHPIRGPPCFVAC